jgi:hypothetical protein
MNRLKFLQLGLFICIYAIGFSNEKSSFIEIDQYNNLIHDLENYLTIGYIGRIRDKGYPFPSYHCIFTDQKEHLLTATNRLIRINDSSKVKYTTSIIVKEKNGVLIDENGKMLDIRIIDENSEEILCYLYEPKSSLKFIGKYYEVNDVSEVKGKITRGWLRVSNIHVEYYSNKLKQILIELHNKDNTIIIDDKLIILNKIIEFEKNKKYRLHRYWQVKSYEEWVAETRNEVLDTNIDNLKL